MSTATMSHEEQLKQVTDAVDQIVRTGVPIYLAKGLTKNHMEALYAYGFNLYNASKHEEAEKIFLALVIYDYTDLKYWMALGSASQMLKKFPNALSSYSFAAMLDDKNPMPAMRGFECHLALKNFPMALAALEAVIFIAGDKPEFAEVKKKAEQLRAGIEELTKSTTTNGAEA